MFERKKVHYLNDYFAQRKVKNALETLLQEAIKRYVLQNTLVEYYIRRIYITLLLFFDIQAYVAEL